MAPIQLVRAIQSGKAAIANLYMRHIAENLVPRDSETDSQENHTFKLVVIALVCGVAVLVIGGIVWGCIRNRRKS